MAKKKVHASRKASSKSSKKQHAKPAAKSRKTGRSVSTGVSLAVAMDHVNWVHATLETMIGTFPKDKITFQLSGNDNHLLWTVGHMATAYVWFASLLDGKWHTLPEGFDQLFGTKSKPIGDPGIYPPLNEVRRVYDGAYQRFIDAAGKLSPADLGKPPAADSHGFARTRFDVLLRAAWHDGWHSGQLSTLRRALGLPSII